MWIAYLLLVFWGYCSQEVTAFILNPVPLGPSRASPSVNIVNSAWLTRQLHKACAGEKRVVGKSNDMCQRTVKQESSSNFAPLSHKNFNEQFPGLLQKWPLFSTKTFATSQLKVSLTLGKNSNSKNETWAGGFEKKSTNVQHLSRVLSNFGATIHSSPNNFR